MRMADSLTTHTSRDFDAEVQSIREQFRAMAARCREQLHLALDAFWTGSKDKMADVGASDNAVDADEKSIDASLLRVLALRQPVASDLRMLTALFKLLTDLERIGDEAVDISRGTAPTSSEAEPIVGHLRKMAAVAENMFNSAVFSFIDGDPRAAEEVRRINGVIDTLYGEILTDSIAFVSRHPREAAPAMATANVAKCLRRVADHAKNIAEGTLFVVRGAEMPR
jgi:phosphate transport system protein